MVIRKDYKVALLGQSNEGGNMEGNGYYAMTTRNISWLNKREI
jgi:hypothetical protein